MKRSAFTLVELLVVIAIMAILLGILGVTIGPALLQSEEAATRALIAQLDQIIKDRQQALSQIDVTNDVDQFMSKMGWTPNSTNRQRAEFLVRKNLYRQALPQTQYDLMGFDLAFDGSTAYNGTPAWKATALTEQVDDSPHLPDWCLQFDPNQSAAQDPFALVARNNTDGGTNAQILLFALTRIDSVRTMAATKAHRLPVLNLDDILTRFVLRPAAAADRSAALPAPAPSFQDAWEQPLNFYNWPTGLIAAGGQELSVMMPNRSTGTDPMDPTGTIASTLNSGMAMTAAVPYMNHPVRPFLPWAYHHVDVNSSPLLVSSGPDLQLGLENPENFDPSNLSNLTSTGADRLADPDGNTDSAFDNITNRQE